MPKLERIAIEFDRSTYHIKADCSERNGRFCLIPMRIALGKDIYKAGKADKTQRTHQIGLRIMCALLALTLLLPLTIFGIALIALSKTHSDCYQLLKQSVATAQPKQIAPPHSQQLQQITQPIQSEVTHIASIPSSVKPAHTLTTLMVPEISEYPPLPPSPVDSPVKDCIQRDLLPEFNVESIENVAEVVSPATTLPTEKLRPATPAQFLKQVYSYVKSGTLSPILEGNEDEVETEKNHIEIGSPLTSPNHKVFKYSSPSFDIKVFIKNGNVATLEKLRELQELLKTPPETLTSQNNEAIG